MAIEAMLKKNAASFENVELTVELKSIIINEEQAKVTLTFWSPKVKNQYSKTYMIDDMKGRIDFNRAMFSLGSSKNNYTVWLNKLLKEKTPIKISVNGNGFIRYIKVLEKSHKEYITKSILIDNIEGVEHFSEEDREFLMSLSLAELKKELSLW